MRRMRDQPTPFDSRRSRRAASRDWWIALSIVFAVILFRAAIFVFWERSHFDSDQAITGLMAKHLAEGRAFPVFYYGQSYMLGIQSWLAAPLFLLFGSSVTALKLPILAINLGAGYLLMRGFVREAGLQPLTAVVPTLFFALPSAGTAARFVEANGGNVEPFLYVLLIWTLRQRPLWCGIVFGIGFLHREFTLYGFAALLVVEAVQWWNRRGDAPDDRHATTGAAWRLAATSAVAAAVWAFVQWLKQFSSGAGPGTSLADVYRASDNITELANRVCVDPRTAASGFYKLATEHWPVLFGTLPETLRDFGIVSTVNQGTPWSAGLLLLLAAFAVVVILSARRLRGAEFCLFLVLTALFSITGYVVGRCGAIDFYYMRYELLSVLGIAGLGGWLLASGTPRTVKRLWLALALAWFALIAVPHLRLWDEYLRRPPEDIRRTIIAALDARGVRYAASRYWVAYALTFLTDERIVVKSSDFVRIREYETVVDRHASEMWKIERDPCPGGEEILPRVYFCR